MNKKIAILVMLVLCLTLFFGCGKDAGNDQQSDSGLKVEATKAEGAETAENNDENKSETNKTNEEGTATSDSQNSKTSEKTDVKVPEGKPLPVTAETNKVNKKVEYKATLTISCETVLDNIEDFDEAKKEILPEDGIILGKKEIVFYEGETVFDVLLRETKSAKIHMEFVKTPIYGSNYIEGINNIYEFDCGELSGWMYMVNDWFPNYGCSRYELSEGDDIKWLYTCDLGRDIGGDFKAQTQEKTEE